MYNLSQVLTSNSGPGKHSHSYPHEPDPDPSTDEPSAWSSAEMHEFGFIGKDWLCFVLAIGIRCSTYTQRLFFLCRLASLSIILMVRQGMAVGDSETNRHRSEGRQTPAFRL